MRSAVGHELNKLKVGDRVQLTKEVIHWYARYLPWLFSSVVVQGKATFNLFDKKHFAEVAFWSSAAVSKEPVFGEVIEFGDSEDASPRLNVFVKLKWGRRIIKHFFSEENLIKV